MKRTVIKPGQIWVTRRGKNTRTPFRAVKAVLAPKEDDATVTVAYSSGGDANWLHVIDHESFMAWIRRHQAKPTRTRRPRTLVLRPNAAQ